MGSRGLTCFLLIFALLGATGLFGQENELIKAEEHYWTHKDSSAYYFEIAFDLAKSKNDSINAFGILCEKVALFSYHRDRLQEKNELVRADSLLGVIAKSNDISAVGKYYKYYHWYNKGSYHYNLHDYAEARMYFLKLRNVIKEDTITNEDFSSFETVANSFIATMYSDELKYELAGQFYEHNLRLHKKYGHDDEAIYDTKNLIAALKAKQKRFRVSNLYARESIAWMLKFDVRDFENSFISTSILLINNYLALGQPDSATYYVDLIKKEFPDKHGFQVDLAISQAGIAKQKGEYDNALVNYRKALIYAKEKGVVDEIALVFQDIGELYYDTMEYDEALKNYLKAASYFKVDSHTHHEKAKASNRIAHFPILLGLSKIYGSQKSTRAWAEQIAIGQTAIMELLQLKSTFYDDTDKQVLVENVLPIFEKSIEACYQRYQRSGQRSYIDTAFVFFERSKGNILLDAFHKNNATLFAGVPTKLLEQEKILKISIADKEREIQEGDSLTRTTLFELKREHERLLSVLEKKHPAYFELKYDKTVTGLKGLQNTLAKQQTAISYFFGDEAVYAIRISNEDKALYKVPFSKKELAQIETFKRHLANPKSDIVALNKNSFGLYQKFVAPFLKGTHTEKLLIIPDGILQSLPFGALNTDVNTKSYLIQKYGIAYANSATLWSRLEAPKKGNPNYLAVAPSFKTDFLVNDIAFAPLPNASREVDALATYFEGTAVKDEAATVDAFKQGLQSHSILHLATHARINDRFPEYSFLTFTPDTTTSGVLYINDLYALDVTADLVTLSACETGLGELQKGEGAISLARAFFYSGASSIVQTSWSINDGSTPEIMDAFYGQLSDGSAKDDALQYAKLVFLKKHDENRYSHPFYWSGFLLSGNTEPLVGSFDFAWYHYLLIGLAVVSVFLIFRRKDQSKVSNNS